MHRFYSEEIQGETAFLDSEESRHLSKVLRLTDGDRVELIDGSGNLYRCLILEAHSKKVRLKIESRTEVAEQHFGVEIAAAPTKNMNRWEWFLEKATEIGIDAIHPIFCENSERKVLKTDRQLRILKSAIKQSHKVRLPKLNEDQSFKEFIKQAFEGEKYIAHCHELPKMKLTKIHSKGKKALILIGPEGDFSESEIKLATAEGFVPVSLGKSRLRTETAALVACHTIHLINA
ncbi:MAG: 16S rRNA (uracil(1498)-N(3))-methyltransferase [Vicingaceae bacterium]